MRQSRRILGSVIGVKRFLGTRRRAAQGPGHAHSILFFSTRSSEGGGGGAGFLVDMSQYGSLEKDDLFVIVIKHIYCYSLVAHFFPIWFRLHFHLCPGLCCLRLLICIYFDWEVQPLWPITGSQLFFLCVRPELEGE
eukprot:jgi/Botrbrau1/13611/Bobra.0069s0008.1